MLYETHGKIFMSQIVVARTVKCSPTEKSDKPESGDSQRIKLFSTRISRIEVGK